MTRQVGKRAHARHAPPAVYELAAYSIFGFCLAHGLSRRKFYYMLEAGEGPRLMKCGRRTLISVESAQRWRRAREPASARPQHHGRRGATAVTAFAKFIGAGARADDRRYVPPRVTGTRASRLRGVCLRLSQGVTDPL